MIATNFRLTQWRALAETTKFAVALALAALLASAALYAQSQFRAGYYSSEHNPIIRQTLPIVSSGATFDVGAYPLFPALLPAGAGQQEVQAYCNTCHSPRYITMQPPLPPDAWAAEVTKMIKMYGASIPDDATQRIIQYLQANFAVGNRKR